MTRTKAFDEQHILDRAVALFWQKGFLGTSAQELVTCLGISRSSLYDTFGDKRTLFLAALQRYHHQQSQALMALVDQSNDLKETVRQLLQGFTRHKETVMESSRGCFLVNTSVELAPHEADIAAIIKANRQEVEDVFYRAVQKGQAQGQVSATHDARALARFLFNSMVGLQVAVRAGADQRTCDDIIGITVAALH